MHFVEILRGAGIILFIVALAGAIAYVGDRVGHQVGRKRLTIFNIRPRYTSTIVAVGTGMVIALAITLIAIFASNEVKTAFFRLNAINAEIQRAQAKAQALENKVNNEHVVIGLDDLMSPTVGTIPLNAPSGLRHDRVQDFYNQTVSYVDRVWTRPPYNLKKYVPPANIAQILDSVANSPKTQAAVSQNDVLLIATAYQNLYQHDPIHFAISGIPDRLVVPGGQPIASLIIPSGRNVSAQIALGEMVNTFVPRQITIDGMPPYFASNVFVAKTLPADLGQMQRTLANGSGNYIMTAFAAQPIYPHTFGVPIVVTLQKAP